ncbi:hypothetical protein [Cellulomonas sp. P5_C5]
MPQLVEISAEAVAGVRADLEATRSAIEDGMGPLRWRASGLGVSTAGFDEALAIADRLGTTVLPVVDAHLARARDLANLRYGGALGPAIPVVDDDSYPFTQEPLFGQSRLGDGSTALSWPAAPTLERHADEAATRESQSIGAWFSDRWDDVTEGRPARGTTPAPGTDS